MTYYVVLPFTRIEVEGMPQALRHSRRTEDPGRVHDLLYTPSCRRPAPYPNRSSARSGSRCALRK